MVIFYQISLYRLKFCFQALFFEPHHPAGKEDKLKMEQNQS